MATKTMKIKTTLTDAAIRRFLGSDGAQLSCKTIKGFHLLKTTAGASWRYRYTDLAGDRQLFTIGKHPALSPAQAVETLQTALTESNGDPCGYYKARKHKAVQEKTAAKTRTLRDYLEGPYTEFQARKKNAGKHNLQFITANFEHLMDRDMLTIGKHDIHSWQRQREKQGRSYVYLERSFRQLKTMMNQAVKDEVLPHNPLKDVSLLEREAGAAEPDYQTTRRLLTDKEIAGIHKGLKLFAEEIRKQRRNSREHGKAYLEDLDAVELPHWFIPFCLLDLYTGLRPGDLYTLTWTELNLNFKRLDKVLEKTKHHRNPARVSLTLPDEIVRIMKTWWTQNGKPLSGLVFPSPVTGGVMDKKAHEKPWTRVKRLGKLEDLNFYAFRHNFISVLITKGYPLKTVAELVGHKTTMMIERHYAHLCPAQGKQAMEDIGRAMGVSA